MKPALTTSGHGSEPTSFHNQLKCQVQAYLDENKLKPQGPWQMYLKTIEILGLWIVTYISLMVWGPQSPVLAVIMVLTLAFFTLCVEMGVMHDASHRAWSKSPRSNRWMGITLFLAGCSTILWYHKHVIAHHGHTNVPGEDHDIESGGLFRFHRGDKWHCWHKIQHYYAFPLYSLLILKWVYVDDIKNALSNCYNLSREERARLWIEILLSRISHLLLFIVVPFLYFNHIGMVMGIYLVHWLVVGLVLALVFQLAHISNVQEYPESFNATQKDWASHQLETTADFAVGNRFLTWVVGGLNFQVEHHIFPRVSHIHYPKIQPIVKRLCEQYGVKYSEYPSCFRALAAHLAQLKMLSRQTA